MKAIVYSMSLKANIDSVKYWICNFFEKTIPKSEHAINIPLANSRPIRIALMKSGDYLRYRMYIH